MSDVEANERRAEIHHRHSDVTGGWLRPAVFGAMDGLVSNLALISGVAGGGVASETIVLAGMAGLGAGAFSMAAGEYTSVATQSELALAELEKERQEIRRRPEAEEEELALLYMARGVEPELARKVAAQVSSDPEQALMIHAREELGVDPTDLPSPTLAAVSSFFSFLVGAVIPVLPYLLGADVLWPALVVSLVGLFGAGALASRLTSRNWWYSGMRQLVFGAAAAGLTYLLGNLVDAGLT